MELQPAIDHFEPHVSRQAFGHGGKARCRPEGIIHATTLGIER
jgi:hypothetical protein